MTENATRHDDDRDDEPAPPRREPALTLYRIGKRRARESDGGDP